MGEIRVSGLDSVTTDAIGAAAILLRDQHPDDALPDHPALTAPKLIRPGARKPFDPGIDFTESEW